MKILTIDLSLAEQKKLTRQLAEAFAYTCDWFTCKLGWICGEKFDNTEVEFVWGLLGLVDRFVGFIWLEPSRLFDWFVGELEADAFEIPLLVNILSLLLSENKFSILRRVFGNSDDEMVLFVVCDGIGIGTVISSFWNESSTNTFWYDVLAFYIFYRIEENSK